MVSRVERTPFAAWWWTVDRLMLVALLALMLAGIVLSLAASPPVAARLGLEPFYFVHRHVMFLLPRSWCCSRLRFCRAVTSGGLRSWCSSSASR